MTKEAIERNPQVSILIFGIRKTYGPLFISHEINYTNKDFTEEVDSVSFIIGTSIESKKYSFKIEGLVAREILDQLPTVDEVLKSSLLFLNSTAFSNTWHDNTNTYPPINIPLIIKLGDDTEVKDVVLNI